MIQVGDRVAYTGEAYSSVPTGTHGTVVKVGLNSMGRLMFYVEWDTRKGRDLFAHRADKLSLISRIERPQYREDI